MEKVTPTIYGIAVQTALLMGITPTFLPKSTLNEYFEVRPSDTLGANDDYSIDYVAIGNGGHKHKTGPDGFPLTGRNHHNPGDVSCFKPLPWIMRPVADDLTASQRNRYAMRTVESHNGQDYYCYYLRRLNKSGLSVNMTQLHIQNGVVTKNPFIPDDDNLRPTPIQVTTSTGSTIETDGDYLVASCVNNIVIDEHDAAEIRNAADIIYGDPEYAIISELVMVSGSDRQVTGPGPGNTSVTYTEAVCCVPVSFMLTKVSMVDSNLGETFTVDVGAHEPLLVRTN